jgi:transketolase
VRKQFTQTVENILAKDEKVVLLLGDIGVFGFNKSFKLYPERVYNIGILEQSTIGVASGLSMTGFIPIVHTIAPFITERCLEQIKDDFGYQQLGGNIVSVGASYDYSSLGCTHQCPSDIGILMNVPEVQIIVPGTSGDFDVLFKQSYNNNIIKYFRLSERENIHKVAVKFGQANVIKKGKLATVIAVGPLLDTVINATKDLDITVIYLTTIRPLDLKTIGKNIVNNRVLICEPYYSGAITEGVLEASNAQLEIRFLGVPRKFLTNYGTVEEFDKHIGFTEKNIFNKTRGLING